MKTKRINKWLIVSVVQGNYGGGWEDVTEEETRREGLAQLRTYRENEPQYPHRLISRRELNPAWNSELAGWTPPATIASADLLDKLVGLTNELRAREGLPPLEVEADEPEGQEGDDWAWKRTHEQP